MLGNFIIAAYIICIIPTTLMLLITKIFNIKSTILCCAIFSLLVISIPYFLNIQITILPSIYYKISPFFVGAFIGPIWSLTYYFTISKKDEDQS